MELQRLIDQYIEFLKHNDYSDRTVLRYGYLLSIFYEFLNTNKISDTTLVSYLNGINPKDIMQSVEYYVKKGANSEDTIYMYCSVISEFFKYIKLEFNIGNDDLIKSFGLSWRDDKSFSYVFKAYNQKLLSMGLIKPSKQGIPFSDEQVKIIVQYCDNKINDIISDDKLFYERLYNQYVKSLSIKLITYMGVSIDRINAIEEKHYDPLNGTLVVADIKIHLPYRLGQQFYYFYKNMYKNNPKSLKLLSLYNGVIFSQPSVLGAFIGKKLKLETCVQNPYSIVSLAKYAIIQLIDAGLDQSTIMELTGYGNEIYDSCRQIADRVDLTKKNSKVDRALKQLMAYDFL